MSLRRVDIPALLQQLGIEARHRNRTWIARCPDPDHKDRSPSWYIRDEPGGPNHGWHYCYACHYGGGLVALVCTVRGVEPGEAKALLEGKALPPPLAVELVVRGARKPFRFPQGVQIAPLDEWPTPARRYVTEDRGVTAEQVARWGLGFATHGRLAGRIVIPVRSAAGALECYTARAFVRSPKRYLEPKSEEGPARGAVFGEQYWPDASERRRVIVTEGSFDAMAVERATDDCIAACFGSHLDALHIMRIASFPEVIIASDPDEAGERLSGELAHALARHVDVRFAKMPEGHDPCSLACTEGLSALREALGVESSDGYREAVPF